MESNKEEKYHAQFNDGDEFKKQHNVFDTSLPRLKKRVKAMNYAGIAITIIDPKGKLSYYKPRRK